MAKHVYLEVSDSVYEQAEALAQATQRPIEVILSEQLEESLTPFFQSDDHLVLAAQDEAYHRLHSTLVETYLGDFVAIHQGIVVDHDPNETALIERMEENYPNATVLIRKVTGHLPRIINMPSFRLIR